MALQHLDKVIPQCLLTPVKEALAYEGGGEIVVRKGGLCGRIFVCKGKIAWVTCSSIPKRLREVLVEEAHLKEQDLSAVLAESKHTGTGFAETLLGWGLLDQQTLSRCLLLHNARHFQGIVALGNTMHAMFIPQPIHYAAEFLYTLEEISRTFLKLPVRSAAKINATVELSETLKKIGGSIPGFRYIAIAHTNPYELLARWPVEEEPESLRQNLQDIWNGLLHNSKLEKFDCAIRKKLVGNGADLVVVSRDSLISAQRLGDDHFVIIQCDGLSNMGMILSRSRACLAELIESIKL